MNREMIMRKAYERIAWMDSNLASHHVTDAQQCYYRLLTALCHADLNQYYSAFGWTPINQTDAYDAKLELGWGELTSFEREVIAFVNTDIERK